MKLLTILVYSITISHCSMYYRSLRFTGIIVESMTLPGVIVIATSIPIFTWPIVMLGVMITTLDSVPFNPLVMRRGSVNNYHEKILSLFNSNWDAWSNLNYKTNLPKIFTTKS